ncbi:MAG TPA: FxSxx-COOH system tetratricopeptide repeat protein [Streptosporangiaceae bacterium]
MDGDRADFFVSHAGADRAWAEWVAWQLIDAGYAVELDVWDWAVGRNFVTAMSDALDRAGRVIALFSAAYFDRSRYTTEEWAQAVLHVPGPEQGRLVPVRVEEVPAGEVPAVLRPLVFCDLFGLSEEQARQVLLEAVAGPRRPGRKPEFPGTGALGRLGGSAPRLPGRVPRIWNIPARNPGFTGRDRLLVAVREMLLAGDRAVVQALHGIGGVGKTQLAIEYAYRFAGAYGLAWWVSAEHGGLIGEQFAALGSALGCVPAGAGIDAVRWAVLAELRQRDRWLLVFDNAEQPADIVGWLPGGGGHVLVTSRGRGWTEIAAAVEVDVLARAESVAILQARVAGLDQASAGRLAGALGDLPLAIAQAAGFMAETGMPAAEYLELLRTRAGQLLAQVVPGAYPRSLAAATQISHAKLAGEDPAAAELASLCAFLAPDPIPEDLFTEAGSCLPGELAIRAADPLAWRQTLARLSRQSLVRIDHRGLQMHRLTQAILRDQLTPEQAAAARASVEAMLAASGPGEPANHPASWARWAHLMPHVLAADPAITNDPGLRWLACNACRYLLARGDMRTGHDLASRLRRHWSDRLGSDHEHTLEIAQYLGWAFRVMGRYGEARDLDRDTLARKSHILGKDHPSTLTTANNLAIVLRHLDELHAARELAQDTLDRRRRVLGWDHPDTLASANNLAIVLGLLDELHAARELGEDTFDRYRRVLGEDHPDTVRATSALAGCLRELGELHAARQLAQDALNCQQRILGEDHPTTLSTADHLARCLRELGETRAACDLTRDTLDRRRRILGEDHPRTVATASRLAEDLAAIDGRG